MPAPKPTAADILGPAGPVGRYLPGYEPRSGQIAMAELIEQALADGTHAVIEAGTGTGKSLAYLIPAILSGKRVIISTANKALQEQLVRKDIPFLKEVLPAPFASALVKGRNNYLCLDRFNNEEAFQQIAGERDWSHLRAWQDRTLAGDFDDLDVAIDRRLISRVMSTPRTCIGDSCDFYTSCYVERMRGLAEGANIVVCNHALLLADLRLRDMGAHLLPDRDAIVIDEAHHLEESAISGLTVRWSRSAIPDLTDNSIIRRYCDASTLDRLVRLNQELFLQLERSLGRESRRGGKTLLVDPLPAAAEISVLLSSMAETLRRENPHKSSVNTPDARRFGHILEWTSSLTDDTRLISKACDDDSVRYLDAGTGATSSHELPLEIDWAPIDVSTTLKNLLFDAQPVICTSATMTVGQSFAYFQRGVGLDQALSLIVPSHFDFPQQCLLYVPTTLPEFRRGGTEGDSTHYTLELAREVYRLVMASQGRAFCLFTSYRMMEDVYEIVSKHLSFVCLKQGNLARPELLRRFKTMQPAVLFATRSFWEGVDVSGDALSLVVIDKMPFSVPDDPVIQARVARVKARGEDWFSDLVLPAAILQLKQGFGRLIRTHTDRGVVAILDKRLLTRGYGTLVLDSLPPARRTSARSQVKAFFAYGATESNVFP